MSKIEENFIPLGGIMYSPTVRFDLPLPEFVPQHQIGINYNKIHQLCRLGGIGHLRVTGKTDGDVTNFTPTIVGYDSQGNAYAGKKGTQVDIPLFEISNESDSDLSSVRPHAATWINATLNLNINEITERIKQEPRWERGVYSPKAWAYHLNHSLKESISTIGIRHLTLGLNRRNWFMSGLQHSLAAIFEMSSKNPSLEWFAFRMLVVNTVLTSLYITQYGGGENGYRLSLFYGPQLDRALLLKLLTSRATLAKGFENHERDSIKK